MKRRSLLAAVAAGLVCAPLWLIGLGCLGCTSIPRDGPDPTVNIVGSDTMLPLVQRWAEEFMATHRRVSVHVTGGGTGAGVRALVSGRAQICAASRPLAPEEVQQLFESHQTLGVRFRCALDALSVYLHPDNPVRELTLDELRRIFSGEITSWSAVGGLDEDIHVLIRPPTSGTHRFFRHHVLGGGAYAASAHVLPTTRAIINRIHANPQAIGYGGLAYAPGLTHCTLNGASPTLAAVLDQSYPLARYLQLYTTEPPRGAVKELIDWIVGAEGQQLVETVGYIPLWPRRRGLHAPFTPET